jgi:excisionase family DNA binding protein
MIATNDPRADLIEQIEAEDHSLTVHAFAELLGVSGKTIYRAIRSGGLRAIRTASIYRIDPSDAANWARKRIASEVRERQAWLWRSGTATDRISKATSRLQRCRERMNRRLPLLYQWQVFRETINFCENLGFWVDEAEDRGYQNADDHRRQLDEIYDAADRDWERSVRTQYGPDAEIEWLDEDQDFVACVRCAIGTDTYIDIMAEQ